MAYCSYFQAMNGSFNQESAILQLVAQALACFDIAVLLFVAATVQLPQPTN